MYNTQNVAYSQGLVPTAFITKGKQRIKQFNNQVYLNDGDSFQIELFNPHSSKILTKIKLNGKYISGGGIVLRPGERVFLERYLDENKSFIFKTYEVNGSSEVVQKAIAANGSVQIEFYTEYQPITTTYVPPYSYTSTHGYSTGTTLIGGASCYTAGVNLSSLRGSTLTTNISSTNQDADLKGLSFSPEPRKLKKSLETGTVEKGSKTEQKLITVDGSFSKWAFHTVNWHILPVSTKPLTSEELNVTYCGDCGAKRKKSSHKFCPQCGNKF